MAAITFTHEPSLAELQETESVYTRAMEYLVADGVKETEAREAFAGGDCISFIRLFLTVTAIRVHAFYRCWHINGASGRSSGTKATPAAPFRQSSPRLLHHFKRCNRVPTNSKGPVIARRFHPQTRHHF